MKMAKLKVFFKRHIGVIIMCIILLVFPISLSNHAKLNMRSIATGFAIDKSEDKFEVTVQYAKVKPGNESPGTGAEINFITETGETISVALSKLKYKTGKVLAYSHINFVVVGKDVAEDDAAECLDIFVRDKLIRNSSMVLFSEGKASDEIKKTKDMELSVGLELQKAFLYKQEDSFALMTTVLNFLSDSNTYSKTVCSSVLSLGSDEETMSEQSGSGKGSASTGDSSGEEGGSSKSQSSSGQGSGGSSGEGAGSGSGGSAGGGSGGSVYFKTTAPVYVFVDGKLTLKFEDEAELFGFMLASKKSKKIDLAVENIECEKLKGAKVSVSIKNKTEKLSVRFENEIPCLDITVAINDSEIVEILSDNPDIIMDEEVYDAISKAVQKKCEEGIARAFLKAQEGGADVFGAYEMAYKKDFGKTKKYYPDAKDFIKNLKVNVDVKVKKLEF